MSSQDYTELDRAVRMHIYYHFAAQGRPPTTRETAQALNEPDAAIQAAYQRLADAHLMVLESGSLEVRMANPLSAVPTPFRVETLGRSWYGNCVWDALGVIAMFGGDGRVIAECGDCGEPLELVVQKGALVHGEGLIHFSLPAAKWWDDIIYT